MQKRMFLSLTSRSAAPVILCALVALRSLQGEFSARVAPSIRGHVVAADSGMPIGGVAVTLLDREGVLRSLDTDARGRFQFDGVPSGQFRVRALKPGWVPLMYGARHFNEAGTGVLVPSAGSESELKVQLTRVAVVAGQIVDANGQPVLRAMVTALRLGVGAAGDRGFHLVRDAFDGTLRGNAATDGRGHFRIFDLPPGKYVIRAQRASTSRAAPMQWTEYPTETEGVGTFIALKPADEKTVSIVLADRAGYRISGIMSGLAPDASTTVVVDIPRPTQPFRETAVLDLNNRFAFEGLPPGDYLVQGRAVPSGSGVRSEPLWAQTSVHVGTQDVAGLELPFFPTVSFKGRVELEVLKSAAVRLKAVHLVPQYPWHRQPTLSSSLTADGDFSILGVAPGRYVVEVVPGPDSPLPVAVATVKLDGSTFQGGRIEIGTNEFPSDVSVRVLPLTHVVGKLLEMNRPATDYTVLIFPEDASRRARLAETTRCVRPNTEGEFDAAYLLPGGYRIAALVDFDPDDVGDPAWLETLLPGSLPIMIQGTRAQVDIRVVGR